MKPRFIVVVDPKKCTGCHICICLASPVFTDPPGPDQVAPVVLPPEECEPYESDVRLAVENCPEEAISVHYPTYRLTARGVEPAPASTAPPPSEGLPCDPSPS
jgi:ferredoxin